MKQLNFLFLALLFLVTTSVKSNAQCSVTVSGISNVTCFGICNGSAQATATGGTAPYTYTINPPVTINATTGLASNLCAGVYTVTITDALSCNSYTTFLITEPPIPIVNTTITNVTCPALCNGSVQVNVIGGTSPYNFSFSPNLPGNPIFNSMGFVSNLCAGTYTISVVDANGCTVTSTAWITQPAPPAPIVATTVNSPTCNPGCDGSVTLSTPPPSSFTYSIMPTSATISGNTVSGICAGTNYTVVGTDMNGCTTSVNYINNTVTNTLTGVAVTSVAYDEACLYSNDGAIDVSTTPSAGLSYVWNTSATTQDVSNVPSGNYWVKITNAVGDCMYYYDTIGVQGSNCGTIQGTVFIDNNSDCISNAPDVNLMNKQIVLSTGDTTLTDNNGFYQFSQVPYGTHTITEVLPSNYYLNYCTQPNTVTLNASNSLSTNNNFKDSVNATIDENIYMYSTNYIPGLAPTSLGAKFNIYINNPSPIPVSNKVTLVINSALNYSSASIAPNTITPTANGDSLTWFITNPAFSWWNSSATNQIIVYVNTPTTLTLGTLLTSCATLTPTIGADIDMSNNHYCATRWVSTSFDPNDKAVNPIGVGAIGGITLQDKQLDYRIRFQNTGTALAYNIYVMDTLSDKLDMNTLAVVDFSHPYQIEVLNGHILKFKFNNIMLPDSNTNEPASHGYIAYKIQQKSTNQLGDEIKNRASIYFDFNTPVLTNQTLNTIVAPTGFANIEQPSFAIYPNPAQNEVLISSNDLITHVSISDVQGKLVLQKNNIHAKTTQLNTSTLPNGIYVLKCNYQIQKLIIAR